MRLALIALVLLAGCATTAEQSDIDWFVGAMLRLRHQGYLSNADLARADKILDRMNDAEFSYVMALIGPMERELEEQP